jgi:deoxyribonucleoside regulator
MSERNNDDLLYEIAEAYYVQKKLQREIAERYGISRVQISKYLKQAEERGFVKIEVIPPRVPKQREEELFRQLRGRFRLGRLLLMPGSKSGSDNFFRFLAKRFFEYLAEKPDEACTVGLGWGQTVYELSASPIIDNFRKSNWNIVPLSGGLSSINDKFFNINHIVGVFAEKIGAKNKLLYLPFLIEDRERLRTIEADRDYMAIGEMWDRLDMIVFSVGASLGRSPFFRQYSGSSDYYINQLSESDVVGDFLTHYYDIDGNIFELDVEAARLINVSTAQFRAAKERVLVAGGSHKVKTIVGMLRTGMVDVMVSDEKTVESVLEFAKEQG